MPFKLGDISLYKFQKIEETISKQIPEIDKTLFVTCILFDLTEYQLDNMPAKKALRLIRKTEKVFQSEVKPRAVERFGEYEVNYDPSRLTLGQYAEVSYFLQQSASKVAHYVLASITGKDTTGHRDRADYFLTQSANKTLGTVARFVENYIRFNAEYPGLFGEGSGEPTDSFADRFIKRYAWIYNATQVAEHERITLDEAFALPIRQALNALMYLKEKDKYDNYLLKKVK